MNNLYDLKFYVENELAGVPEQAVCFSLRQSLREFCRRSGAWIGRTYTQISKEMLVYSAVGFHDADLVLVRSVKVCKATNDICSETDLQDECVKKLNRFEKIQPRFYDVSGNNIVFRPGVLQVFDGGWMAIQSSLKPTLDSANVSADVIEQYAEVIIAGSIADLAKQKNRPWFDPDVFQLNQSKYQSLLNSVMAKNDYRGFCG